MSRSRIEHSRAARVRCSCEVRWLAQLLILMAGVAAASTLTAQDGTGSAADEGLGGLLEGLDLGDVPAPDANAPDANAPDADSPDSSAGPAAPKPTGEQPTPGEQLREGARSTFDSPLVEAYRSMQMAKSLLAEGEAGAATLTAQQRAVDLLDQLIQAAQQQSQNGGGRRSADPADASAEGPTGPPNQAGQQASGEAGREGADAGEEGESVDDPAQEDAGQGSRRGGGGEPGGQQSAAVAAAGRGAGADAEARGASVWGHLPEQTRGMLRSEVPTEYLPRYAEETSEYFRILAEMNPDE